MFCFVCNFIDASSWSKHPALIQFGINVFISVKGVSRNFNWGALLLSDKADDLVLVVA
jgi:hypothetical protein